MSDIKVPGVVWIIGIVVAVAAAHYFLDDPFVVDMVVIVAGMVLKSLNLGTTEENQAIDIIDAIKKHPRLNMPVVIPKSMPGVQMRGPSGSEGATVESQGTLLSEPPILPATPPRPNKMVRWLVG